MAAGNIRIKMILVSPEELDRLVRDAVREALIEREVSGKTGEEVDRVVKHQLRLTRGRD